MQKAPTKKQLLGKLAYLEFVEDQLSTELQDIDELLKAVGFPEGIQSVKEVAREMLDNKTLES